MASKTDLACLLFVYGFLNLLDDVELRKKPARRIADRTAKALARAGTAASEEALDVYNAAITSTLADLDGITIKPEKTIAAMFAHRGEMLQREFNMEQVWAQRMSRESGAGLMIDSVKAVTTFLRYLDD
jgi:hypothetical protein